MRLSPNVNELNEKEEQKKLRKCAQKYLNLQINKTKADQDFITTVRVDF